MYKSLEIVPFTGRASHSDSDAHQDPAIRLRQRNVSVRKDICMWIIFIIFFVVYCVVITNRTRPISSGPIFSSLNLRDSLPDSFFVLPPTRQSFEGSVGGLCMMGDSSRRCELEHICRPVQNAQNVIKHHEITKLPPEERSFCEFEPGQAKGSEEPSEAAGLSATDDREIPIKINEGVEEKEHMTRRRNATNGHGPGDSMGGFPAQKDSPIPAPNPSSTQVRQPLSVRDKLDYLLGWRGPVDS
jgi:hypothetical protein